MAEHTPRCPLHSEEHAQLLLSYCARQLDPDSTATLQRHIDICPACQQFLDSQQLVWDALDAWERTPISSNFDSTLLERIRDDGRPAWANGVATWTRTLSWKPALPAAAILALWIIAYPTSYPEPDAAQAEQVELALEDLEMLQQLPLAPK